MREGHVGGRQQVHLLPVWNKGLLFSIFIDSCILSLYNLGQAITILLVKLSSKNSLLGASGEESLFQVTARHLGLQHDALQLQHGHHDEGEGAHILLNLNIMTMSCQVNTHFSFPFQLDMSAYMEHTLIPGKAQQAPAQSPIYELIGETVVMANTLIKSVVFGLGHRPFGGRGLPGLFGAPLSTKSPAPCKKCPKVSV